MIIGNTIVGETLKDGYSFKKGYSILDDLFSMNEIEELKNKYNVSRVIITHLEED